MPARTRKPKAPTLTQRVQTLENSETQFRTSEYYRRFQYLEELEKRVKGVENFIAAQPQPTEIKVERSGAGWLASFYLDYRTTSRWRWTRRGAEKAIEKALTQKRRANRSGPLYTYEVKA